MAGSRHITRRAALSTISTAAFAVGIPATGALAAPCEAVCDRVERLCGELSAALGEYQDGQFRAVVGPDDDIWLQNIRADARRVDLQAYLDGQGPKGRANWHMGQLAEAMNEIHPGYWRASPLEANGEMFGVFVNRDYERSKTQHAVQTNFIL